MNRSAAATTSDEHSNSRSTRSTTNASSDSSRSTTPNNDSPVYQIFSSLQRYHVFIGILLAKIICDQATEIIFLVILHLTLYYSNNAIRREATLISSRGGFDFTSNVSNFFSRRLYRGVWVTASTVVATIAITSVVLGDKVQACIFLPVRTAPSIFYMLWVIAVNDYIVKFVFITFKIFILSIKYIFFCWPFFSNSNSRQRAQSSSSLSVEESTATPSASADVNTLFSRQKQGKCLQVIEVLGQLYRQLIPINVWFYFFFATSPPPSSSSNEDSYTIYDLQLSFSGVLLFSLYMAFKGLELVKFCRTAYEIFQTLNTEKIYGELLSDEELRKMQMRDRTAEEGSDESGINVKSSGSLICPICFDVYTRPTKLRCSHIFCHACLEAWFDNGSNFTGNGIGSDTILHLTCPVCRQDQHVNSTASTNSACGVNANSTSLTSAALNDYKDGKTTYFIQFY